MPGPGTTAVWDPATAVELDEFEGGYARVSLSVSLGSGTLVTAASFVALQPGNAEARSNAEAVRRALAEAER